MIPRLFFGIVILFLPFVAQAQEVPTFSNYVVDLASLLDEATFQELVTRLEDHNQRTTNQVAVLTIPSLERRRH